MQARDDSTTASHPALRRLIGRRESRHLQAAMALRFTGGGFQLGVGLVLVSLGRKADDHAERRTCYRWATAFLTFAALNLSGGLLDLAAARNAPPRT